MKIPRDLSGEQLVRHLSSHWRYTRIHQTGSHIILETDDPFQHRIAVPNHKAIRIGTLNAILRSISAHKGVSRDALLERL